MRIRLTGFSVVLHSGRRVAGDQPSPASRRLLEHRPPCPAPCRVLTRLGPWPQDQNRYSSTARQLAESISRNPHLRILVQTGLCDLAVPYLSLEHSINHLGVDPELLKNVRYVRYDSGHMMYLRLEDLARLARDLRAFLGAPAEPSAGGD